MAAKHLLTLGIGLGGSSVFFIVTLGLKAGIAAVLTAYHTVTRRRRR